MNILFITHRFPYPPNRGDSIRSFHFLERFAAMGSVSLASLYDEEPSAETREALGKLCQNVVACRWGHKRRWFRAACALMNGKTMTEGLFFRHEFRNKLRKLVSQTQFDRIVVFCSSMFQYLDVLKGTRNEQTPVVVDLVDVDSQKWFDYAEKARGWKRLVFRTEGRRLRKLEIQIGNRCSALLAVTPEETALYKSFAVGKIPESLRIEAIPNGVKTDFFDPTLPELAAIPELPHRLVFVGALDYRANVGGVEWFVQNVLPPLRGRFADCQFDVVGSNPVSSLVHLAETEPGMDLVGTVPDVRPYLKRASVVVIPLQVARGLQNKVLEACAMARPTVVSPCAGEGIQRLTNDDFRVCAEPEEWVETLTRLFLSNEERAALAQHGQELAEQNYGWNAQLRKLENVLEVVNR